MKKISWSNQEFTCVEKEVSDEINPYKVKYITRVHENSPAAKFGVKAGDIFVSLNNQIAVEVDLSKIPSNYKQTDYLIYCPSERKTKIISTGILPIGIEVEHTSESIVKRSKTIDTDSDELYFLWERGDWNSLKIASKTIRRHWIFLVTRVLFLKGYTGPAILTSGIAEYELGEYASGLKLISMYYEKYMEGYTTDWHALTYYYLGLDAAKNGELEKAEDYLLMSEHFCKCPILTEKLRKQGIEVTSKSPWDNQKFPINFNLPNFNSTKNYQFSSIVKNLASNELLYLCIMPSYRANGPYNDAIATYENVVTCFPNNTSPFYVITNIKDLGDKPEWWIENEQRAIKEGKKIVLLFDENDQVVYELDQNTTPNIYLINSDGIIMSANIDFKLAATWTYLRNEFVNI